MESRSPSLPVTAAAQKARSATTTAPGASATYTGSTRASAVRARSDAPKAPADWSTHIVPACEAGAGTLYAPPLGGGRGHGAIRVSVADGAAVLLAPADHGRTPVGRLRGQHRRAGNGHDARVGDPRPVDQRRALPRRRGADREGEV